MKKSQRQIYIEKPVEDFLPHSFVDFDEGYAKAKKKNDEVRKLIVKNQMHDMKQSEEEAIDSLETGSATPYHQGSYASWKVNDKYLENEYRKNNTVLHFIDRAFMTWQHAITNAGGFASLRGEEAKNNAHKNLIDMIYYACGWNTHLKNMDMLKGMDLVERELVWFHVSGYIMLIEHVMYLSSRKHWFRARVQERVRRLAQRITGRSDIDHLLSVDMQDASQEQQVYKPGSPSKKIRMMPDLTESTTQGISPHELESEHNDVSDQGQSQEEDLD